MARTITTTTNHLAHAISSLGRFFPALHCTKPNPMSVSTKLSLLREKKNFLSSPPRKFSASVDSSKLFFRVRGFQVGFGLVGNCWSLTLSFQVEEKYVCYAVPRCYSNCIFLLLSLNDETIPAEKKGCKINRIRSSVLLRR